MPPNNKTKCMCVRLAESQKESMKWSVSCLCPSVCVIIMSIFTRDTLCSSLPHNGRYSCRFKSRCRCYHSFLFSHWASLVMNSLPARLYKLSSWWWRGRSSSRGCLCPVYGERHIQLECMWTVFHLTINCILASLKICDADPHLLYLAHIFLRF